nr:V2 [Kozo leaf curling associated virus 2]
MSQFLLRRRDLPERLVGTIYMCAVKYVQLQEEKNMKVGNFQGMDECRYLIRLIRRYSRVRNKREVNGDYGGWIKSCCEGTPRMGCSRETEHKAQGGQEERWLEGPN